VAVHAIRLTAELQQSRARLVAAREEERRRLRRDLHDGLGPTLAGVVLGLETAGNLLDGQPSAAQTQALLERLRDETQGAIAGIRRLVYGLRPPALDDLGLVPALQPRPPPSARAPTR
jgi:two-component system, NarL family, sensor kinase